MRSAGRVHQVHDGKAGIKLEEKKSDVELKTLQQENVKQERRGDTSHFPSDTRQ